MQHDAATGAPPAASCALATLTAAVASEEALVKAKQIKLKLLARRAAAKRVGDLEVAVQAIETVEVDEAASSRTTFSSASTSGAEYSDDNSTQRHAARAEADADTMSLSSGHYGEQRRSAAAYVVSPGWGVAWNACPSWTTLLSLPIPTCSELCVALLGSTGAGREW